MIPLIARALGINTALAWLAVVVLAIGALGGIYLTIKGMGADEARLEQERRNNEAGIKGGGARLTRAECVRCGGVYIFDTGRCDGPPACFGE